MVCGASSTQRTAAALPDAIALHQAHCIRRHPSGAMHPGCSARARARSARLADGSIPTTDRGSRLISYPISQ